MKAYGDSESVSTEAAFDQARQEYGTGARGIAAKARRVYTCLYDNTEEAELGDA